MSNYEVRPPSEKQMAYREDLLRKAVAGRYDYEHVQDLKAAMAASWEHKPLHCRADARKTTAIVFALALPVPQTSEEASEQIDGLQSSAVGMISYAREHRDWAQPIMEAVKQAWGDDMKQWPVSTTVTEIRALTGVAQ